MTDKTTVYIGKCKIDLNYSSESEKELLETFSRELNTDLNNLLLDFGRLNDSILLFFLLFRTQKEIFDLSGDEYNFETILKEVSCFLNEKSNLDNQLILGNIVKKNILKKLKKEKSKESNPIAPKILPKQEVIGLIETFNNLVINKIKKLEKNISTS